MVKKITLKAWAAARYDPPPSARTLQKWAREGDLHPPPVKLGRCYYISPKAMHIREMLAGEGSGLVEQLEGKAE